MTALRTPKSCSQCSVLSSTTCCNMFASALSSGFLLSSLYERGGFGLRKKHLTHGVLPSPRPTCFSELPRKKYLGVNRIALLPPRLKRSCTTTPGRRGPFVEPTALHNKVQPLSSFPFPRLGRRPNKNKRNKHQKSIVGLVVIQVIDVRGTFVLVPCLLLHHGLLRLEHL